MAATTSRAATQSRKKPAARRAKTVAPSWRRLRAMAPPRVAVPLLALSVVAVTVVALLMLGTFVFTGRAATSDGGAAAPATVAQQTRNDLVAARRAASCEVYLDLTAAQAQAIGLRPEEGIGALAALVVAVPVEQGSPLEPAFAHLRSALQLDVDAAAWTIVGEQQRALASYRIAEAEALQAEAYAAAVCGDE